MTPGKDFTSVPPRREARGQPRRDDAVRYEYKTAWIKNRWSGKRQDQFINEIAAGGWDLMQREPRGGLLGGGRDKLVFRRRVSASRR